MRGCLWILLAVFLPGLMALPAAVAAGEDIRERYAESRQALGTVVTVDICYPAGEEARARAAAAQVWARMEEIATRMNPYDPDSDISRLNGAKGAPVRLPEDLSGLLQASVAWRHSTEGVFDVTVGPLISLWKEAAHEGVLPLKEAIAASRALVGADRIVFGGNGAVTLPAGMRADVSGNAQGYAADEGVAILRRAGFERVLVDGGGEIRVSGKNCDGQPWRIGVRDPFHPDRLDGVLLLENAGVSSSGSYEKFYTIDGRRFSHIVNPVTGYPVGMNIGATVVAPTSVEADVWSTALCILGPRALGAYHGLGPGHEAAVFSEGPGGEPVRSLTPGFADLYSPKTAAHQRRGE